MAAVSPFLCRRCGACCRGAGYVRLAEDEAAELAACLGIDVYAFTAAYTRVPGDRRGLVLTDRPDGACIFLKDDNSCAVQAAKPAQCRGYPLAWNAASLDAACEGQRPH